MSDPLTVVDWISYDEAEKRETSIGGLGGSFQFGDRWEDLYDEPDEYADALRAAIIRDNIRHGGDWHQDCGCPVFSDGTVGSFSMRAWGDFLAAVWSSHDDVHYGYTDFAWNAGPTAEEAKARGSLDDIKAMIRRNAKELDDVFANHWKCTSCGALIPPKDDACPLCHRSKEEALRTN